MRQGVNYFFHLNIDLDPAVVSTYSSTPDFLVDKNSYYTYESTSYTEFVDGAYGFPSSVNMGDFPYL